MRNGRRFPVFFWSQQTAWSDGKVLGEFSKWRIWCRISWHLTARWMYSAHETNMKMKTTPRRASRVVWSAYRAGFSGAADIVLFSNEGRAGSGDDGESVSERIDRRKLRN